MRIAMFGGSFDPIHLGHLILAEQCREQAQLDEVWLVPCATAPNKQNGSLATDRQRMEMLRLAVGGHPQLVVSDIELKRGGVSYTVDTLAEIKAAQPDAELFLILGADSVHQFSKWHQPEKILELAQILAVERPGQSTVDHVQLNHPETGENRLARIESPLVEISSTAIRNKIAAKQSIRFLTSRSVEKYIDTQNVYQ